jgi:hypothetical protein
MHFSISPFGDLSDQQSFDVDDVNVRPGAFLDLGACPAYPDGTTVCSRWGIPAFSDCSRFKGLDLAIAHLAQNVSSDLVQPMRVVTGQAGAP